MSTIWRKTNKDRKNLTRDIADLLEASGALDWLGPPDAPVILKPNLVVSRPASGGATTTPAIAEGLILYLREAGYRKIAVAEGSWVGDSTARAFRACGYEDLAGRYGIPLIDLQKDEAVSRETGEGKFLLCRTIAELEESGGSLINLPLLKGHGQTRLTCALKNLKGCIPDSEKRRYHSRGVHGPVARLNTLIRPSFALVDGLNPDPFWEEGGSPLKRDLLLLARDPVALDSYAARLLGLDDSDVDYIGMAEALGIGRGGIIDSDIVDLDGGDASLAAPGIVNREGDGDKVRIGAIVEQRSACSSCFGNLASALRRMETLEKGRDKSICVGQEFRGEKLAAGKLGIGSCTSGEAVLPGCPPSPSEIEIFLNKNMSLWLEE